MTAFSDKSLLIYGKARFRAEPIKGTKEEAMHRINNKAPVFAPVSGCVMILQIYPELILSSDYTKRYTGYYLLSTFPCIPIFRKAHAEWNELWLYMQA
jgi:hypothetical protein